MNVVTLPPYPPPSLPPPTSGIPCVFTLKGASSVTFTVWRRRTVTVPTLVPPPGSAPLVSISGSPLSTKLAVLPQAGEVVTLGGSGGPLSYSTFSEDLTSSIGSTLPWIWAVGGGSVVTLTGGAQLTTTARLVIQNDGTVTWVVSGPTS